jgi:hypothetical protein
MGCASGIGWSPNNKTNSSVNLSPTLPANMAQLGNGKPNSNVAGLLVGKGREGKMLVVHRYAVDPIL